MTLVQFTRNVMYSEVFILHRNDEDYIEVEAGTIGQIVGQQEHGHGIPSRDLVEIDGNGGYIYPEDSYTEANPL